MSVGTMTQEILRSTIDIIENEYMKNCRVCYLPHWRKVRRRLFKELLDCQLKDFDCEL